MVTRIFSKGLTRPPTPVARRCKLAAATPRSHRRRLMIEVLSLSKRYGDFPAVTDLSFFAQPGEVLGLVGPNGAGKTSTLRCLAGIIPSTGGTVRLAGHD